MIKKNEIIKDLIIDLKSFVTELPDRDSIVAHFNETVGALESQINPVMEEIDEMKEWIEERQLYERRRLSQYGDQCNMGKCAQSRIHFIQQFKEKFLKDRT